MRTLWLTLGVLLLASCHLWAAEEEVTVEEVTEETEEEPAEITYKTPLPVGNFFLAEHFDDREDYQKRWIVSEAKKEGAEENIAKYSGKWDLEEAEKNGIRGDLGLVLKSKAHHHAISTRLDKPFLFDGKVFILQYEVRFQNGQECGGAYMKLLSQTPNLDLKGFNDKTPYTLMFGPDKCGNDHKVHWIFRHRNPKNGSHEEKHWKKTSYVPKIEDTFKDKKPHLYTLVISPDNTFEVLVDRKSIQKGSLFDEFNPPVNPPSEIDDPNDHKPEDWDEKEKDEDAPRQIPDSKASKPSGWLDEEPELVPDPNAEKPQDWDDEMDGEWEAPLISNPKCEKVGCGEWKAPMVDNPKYKGKWKAPLIDNPNYKGKWKPRRIPNPDFFEDKNPYRMTAIAAVGFELWSMSDGILFDNIIVTDDMNVAEQWASETWALKKEIADRESSSSFWISIHSHPYGWLLYALYCSVPISIFIWHIRKRVLEDNILVRLIKYTNKYPWLWAVYIVVIGLPVVLFISFCCTSSTPKDKQQAAAAHAKKTDAPTPDDPRPSTSSAQPGRHSHSHADISHETAAAPPSSPKRSGVQITELPTESAKESSKKNEEEQDEESGSDINDKDIEVVEDDKIQAEGSQEEEEGEEEGEEEIGDKKKTSPSARRRRARRD